MLGSLPILPLPAPPIDGNLGSLPLSQLPSQPENSNNDNDEENNNKSAPAPVATHTRAIGIIHPPLEIRNIVDKTAHFVAKNGPDFIASNEGNAKFGFLRANDPYHAYYQHKLSENRTQNLAEPTGNNER